VASKTETGSVPVRSRGDSDRHTSGSLIRDQEIDYDTSATRILSILRTVSTLANCECSRKAVEGTYAHSATAHSFDPRIVMRNLLMQTTQSLRHCRVDCVVKSKCQILKVSLQCL
jgi:hypothetical protein